MSWLLWLTTSTDQMARDYRMVNKIYMIYVTYSLLCILTIIIMVVEVKMTALPFLKNCFVINSQIQILDIVGPRGGELSSQEMTPVTSVTTPVTSVTPPITVFSRTRSWSRGGRRGNITRTGSLEEISLEDLHMHHVATLPSQA